MKVKGMVNSTWKFMIYNGQWILHLFKIRLEPGQYVIEQWQLERNIQLVISKWMLRNI
jgi:hypothetical protein